MARGDFIISRFPAYSLTTGTFQWLNSEAWNHSHFEFLSQRAPGEATGLTARNPYVRGRGRSPAPAEPSLWILEDTQEGAPLAWIKVQEISTRFRTLHVTVTHCHAESGWSGAAAEALSLFISALLIMEKADRLVLLPASLEVDADIAALGWGEIKTVWTPLRELAALHCRHEPPGHWRRIVSIYPPSWWESERGQRDYETLAYLRKRMDTLSRRTLQTQAAPRRGWLSRFLRWHR